LHFELIHLPEGDLPIDFQIQEIKKLIVNGQETELKSEEGFILIGKEKLK